MTPNIDYVKCFTIEEVLFFLGALHIWKYLFLSWLLVDTDVVLVLSYFPKWMLLNITMYTIYHDISIFNIISSPSQNNGLSHIFV